MVRPDFVYHAARRGDRHSPSSLSGLADCLAAGASIIEVDIAPLADGGFALVHDARLERLSEGKGLVPAATSAEIQGCIIAGTSGSMRGSSIRRSPTSRWACSARPWI